MVVEILVSQGLGMDPLRRQVPNRVFHAVGVAEVAEAPAEPIRKSDAPIHFPQREHPAVRGDGPSVETGYNVPSPEGMKRQPGWCRLRGRGVLGVVYM